MSEEPTAPSWVKVCFVVALGLGGYLASVFVSLFSGLAWYMPWLLSPFTAFGVTSMIFFCIAPIVFILIGALGVPREPTLLERLEKLQVHTCSCGKQALDKDLVKDMLEKFDP